MRSAQVNGVLSQPRSYSHNGVLIQQRRVSWTLSERLQIQIAVGKAQHFGMADDVVAVFAIVIVNDLGADARVGDSVFVLIAREHDGVGANTGQDIVIATIADDNVIAMSTFQPVLP